MISFNASMQIVENKEQTHDINGYIYDVYIVRVTEELEMLALFKQGSNIKVGDCVKASTVYLTNFDQERTPIELALRVSKFKLVEPNDFELPEYLEVKCNGQIIKSKKVGIRRVGVMRKPFLPCTFRIRNEKGLTFNVLLVSFYKLAKELDELNDGTYVNMKARLFHKTHEPGYELNLSSYELV